MRQDARAELFERQDGIAELVSDKPPSTGIQLHFDITGCTIHCTQCRAPLSNEAIKLAVLPPHEMWQDEMGRSQQRRLLAMTCVHCGMALMAVETRFHFS